MNFRVWGNLTNNFHRAKVGYDKCVGAGVSCDGDKIGQRGHFVGVHKGVNRNMRSYAARMGVFDPLRHLVRVKIFGSRTHSELGTGEIYGVGAEINGAFKPCNIAGGTQ